MASKRITRRDFIKTTAAGALATGLGAPFIVPKRSYGASAHERLLVDGNSVADLDRCLLVVERGHVGVRDHLGVAVGVEQMQRDAEMGRAVLETG